MQMSCIKKYNKIYTALKNGSKTIFELFVLIMPTNQYTHLRKLHDFKNVIKWFFALTFS